MPDDLATFSDEDRDELIKPFSKRKVFPTLKLISRGKSPSLDGLTVEFYVFYWNIIGDTLSKAISGFFFTSNHPKS